MYCIFSPSPLQVGATSCSSPFSPPLWGRLFPSFPSLSGVRNLPVEPPTYHPATYHPATTSCAHNNNTPNHHQQWYLPPADLSPGHHQWYLPLVNDLWYPDQPPGHHQLCTQPPPSHHQWYPAIPPADSSAVAPPTRPSAAVPPISAMLVVPAPLSCGTRLLGSLTSRATVSARLLAAQASTRATARARASAQGRRRVRIRMASRGSGSSVRPLGRDGGTVSVRYLSYYCLSNMSFEQRRRLSMHN